IDQEEDGDDELTGGSGINYLDGEWGDDLVRGGTGQNTIFGREGNDHLIAGPLYDYLDGGFGDDVIELGAGHDVALGDRGNDPFPWNLVNPEIAPKAPLTGDGTAEIDGGGDNDVVGVTGGDHADTFSLVKAAAGFGYEVVVGVPQLKGAAASLLVKQVENFSIEGKGDADSILVDDLTSTSVQHVGVNLGDLVASQFGYGDGHKDHVLVRCTTEADNVTVKAVDVLLKQQVGHESITGGATQFSGLPNYDVVTANVQDDVQFEARGGNDVVNVYGITGPTL